MGVGFSQGGAPRLACPGLVYSALSAQDRNEVYPSHFGNPVSCKLVKFVSRLCRRKGQHFSLWLGVIRITWDGCAGARKGRERRRRSSRRGCPAKPHRWG